MKKNLILALCLSIINTISAQTHVFLIGDSTTTNLWIWDWYPRMGWGAVLNHFFDSEKVIVDNRAVGGTTTKSYFNEYWEEVIADIQSGDYLFISFGANDSNKAATYCTTTDEFIDYIGIFCNAAREKGATPVLLSTVNQNCWTPSNVLESSYGNHPQAMKDAATKYDTPFFDLYTFGFNLSKEVGREYNTYYRHNNYKPGDYDNYPDGNEDNVHLQETGATDYARFIVEEIEKSSDERLKQLADATKPRYNVVFDTDDNYTVSSISRPATFPEGINVTLKCYSVDENKKCCWINETGDTISYDNPCVYVMQNHDEHFTATYYNTTSAILTLADDIRILPNKVLFTDHKNHTINIYSMNGNKITAASTTNEFPLDLPTGTYVLTIDGIKSTKVLIK